MQRIFYAFLAMLTIFAASPRSTQAQGGQDRPVEPTATPTVIGGDNTPAATGGDAPAAKNSDASAAKSSDAPAVSGDYSIPAGRTLENLVVRNKKLVLEGRVDHDILAIDSDVVVKPGAQVGGFLNVVGGSVDNQAGNAVRVVHQDNGWTLGVISVNPVASAGPKPQPNWFGGQFALWLFGMIGGVVLLVMAPTGSRQTSEIVAADRSRSLVLGAITAGIMALVLLFGALLMHLPFRVLLAPFVAAVAIGCAVLFGWGWLCGLASLGNWIQRRTGWMQGGGWYAQVAVGLTACFLINSLLGAIHPNLGAAGLLLESLYALMGMGAALRSGFGSDPEWLTTRLRGEIRWFTPTSRL